MTILFAIEAIATLFWCYAALSAIAWIRHARRLPRSFHVPALAELLGNLVPAMILLVIVILFGALFGLPSVVVLIAILFPAGLSWGLHMTLSEIAEGTPWTRRAALATVLAGLVTALRALS